MLQRAASNAYSWWMASHIRTKQSKWLEQSLQDMGEKVEAVLKLIEEDGDSFIKKAEMYYKKRPEFINFVEESYRAYRSLAERYDHISKELQNANSTLASAFPDQFQFPMDDDDEYSPRVPRKFSEKAPNPNIPKAPAKFPAKNIKAFMALTAKSKNPSKPAPKSANNVNKSGLTKSEALGKIDKLQKRILTLQTEKEFAKSSYESGYAKYWDIEAEITGMQETISKLQDEFKIAKVIEDDEARTLMAEAALKSCQQTLAQLQEKQEKAATEAKAERKRIKDAREKLMSLKGEFLGNEGSQTDIVKTEEKWTGFDDEAADGLGQSSKELDMLRDKIKEHFDVGVTASLTVSEMAEKIDELVNKVISLETSVSSQTAMIHRLRSETDDLQSQIKNLEDDKVNLIDGKNSLSNKLMEMENKLQEIQELNHSFEYQNTSLETHFTEARTNLDVISEKLHNVTPDEEVEEPSKFQENVKTDMVQEENQITHSVPSQDGERGGISAHLESNASAASKTDDPEPSKIDDSEPSKTEDTKPQGHPHQKQPESTALDVAQPQNHSTEEEKPFNPWEWEPESTASIVSQPQENSNEEEEPFNPREKEPEPTSFVVARPQEKSNEEAEEPFNPRETHKAEAASLPRDELVTPREAPQRETMSRQRDELDAASSVQPQEQTRKEEDEPDWQQLFTNGLEGKEKVLLQEYTSTLRNYKEAKKKLGEMENKKQGDLSDIVAQLQDLKKANSVKDEEIHSLRQKLSVLQKRLEEYRTSKEGKDGTASNEEPLVLPEDDEDIKVITADLEREISPVEAKLRADIDEILEENLDFWMRFSASFGQIQKFDSVVEDLQSELAKLEKESEKKEGSSHGSSHGSTHMNPSLKSDVKPLYKHLREIQTELTVWLEQSEKLKEELQRRFSQLCNIQEEITRALNAGAEDDDMKFTSFQAAKFQGEVANMQQENHKVADELQAGMDHITSVQLEVERTTTRLNDELGLSGSKSQNENQMRSGSRGRVPLRSFIFGVKPQKKKQSIFSCMHPGMMHRRYQNLKTDKSL